MFNEREALRLRLEQLNEAEVKVIREYQIERDKIYAKLRELDNTGSLSDTKKEFRPEKKSDSLPVLAELAAQEMRSYQKPQTQPQSSSRRCSLLRLFPPAFQTVLQEEEEGRRDRDQKRQNCAKQRLKH